MSTGFVDPLPLSTSYNMSSTIVGSSACSDVGIDSLNINGPTTIYKNLTYKELFDHEVKNNEGAVAKTKYGDVFTVDTGKFTGRSPADKWIVKTPGSELEDQIWWGSVNQPISPEVFEDLLETAVKHMDAKENVYVADLYAGANKSSRKAIRFVHEKAWQQHFVTNMFIRPTPEDPIKAKDIDFTIINACSAVNDKWKEHGLNSEVAIAFNIEKKIGIVLGSEYGGENKKGVFSLMNMWLPMNDQLSMHCSANVGKDGDTALFFGLSGTGKTTLSADPNRALIGDDEHGWDDDGVFNFEGGCYAKTINLSEENEKEIYQAITKNAMLENVVLNDNVPDYDDVSKTQNGRVSYPIFHIPGYHEEQKAGHAKNVIFLTCDAYGVLPPVSKLTSGQALYQFISGYTSKVAGTERGVTSPTSTFSACFGAAFLTLPPTRYAELLQKKLETHGSHAFLVNTGWVGGGYGVGNRMSIKDTRACIDAILDGSIHNSEFEEDEIFGLSMPKTLNKVDAKVLNPKNAWADQDAYVKQAKELSELFKKNFEKYAGSTDYAKYGPK
jgi:ATP-dependent phosphoenolpyruvate carboxykinase